MQWLYQSLGLNLINTLARLGDYRHQEISFGPETSQRLDWYQVDPEAPTVIFYYGGNWRSYTKESYRFVADTLCGMGLNVVIPEFRKYPEHRFTDILERVVQSTDDFIEHHCPPSPLFVM
ncbi:MAG: hypothetical protein JJ956_17960, partial [Pseudomonadales bacterium]|nr:hypothetical protein [Pseudomonadales bacterium]